MSKITIAAIALAVAGIAGTASAAPLSPGLGLSAGSAVENVRMDCRERTVWRTDKWGHPKRVTVRDCDRMGGNRDYRGHGNRDPRYAEPGGGGRYFHNGQYYSDPGFTIRIR